MKTTKKRTLSFDKQVITNLDSIQILGGNVAIELESDKLRTGFNSSCESSYCD
jgi:hypothetical protein